MGNPTRFSHGLTTVGKSDPLGMFGLPDPTGWHVFWDDFDNFEADQWIITRVGTTPTEAVQDADGGILLLTMAGTDDSADSLQWSGDDNSATRETFKVEAGKKAFFKARFKVSDATQSDFQLGLVITDTTPLDATDGIYFQKDDGDALLDVVCRKNATTNSTSATDIHAVVADTYLTAAWYYDGVSEVKAYVNGNQVASLNASSTYLPDTELTVSIHMQNGEGSAKTMSLDYVFVAKER